MPRTIRIYTENPLSDGGDVVLDKDQVHYLRNVLRMAIGDPINLFNSAGEWQASISVLDKKSGSCQLQSQCRQPETLNQLAIVAAPLKKDSWDFAVHKAVELGATDFYPVFTEYTDIKRVNVERMQATARDAMQQCERLTPMTIHAEQKLDRFLSDIKIGTLFICAEKGQAQSAMGAFAQDHEYPYILIGPEGGFSDREFDLLHKKEMVQSIHLGPRILKAETALVSALTLWQVAQGDWQDTKR